MVITRALALSLSLAVAVALSSCSGDEPAAAPSATSPSTSTPTGAASATAVPDVWLEGGDPGMQAALHTVYAGHQGFEGTVTTGEWKGERVAVVKGGSDVTLLVGRGTGSGTAWKVVGGWWPSLSKPVQVGKGPRHVLVIGSDARVGEPLKGTRGDTLQLVGIDTRGGAA